MVQRKCKDKVLPMDMELKRVRKRGNMELLKGIDVANAINEKLIKEGADMGGRVPKLAIIRVGERPDDMSYERGATKKMEKVGFACETFVFPETIDNEAFQKEFDAINDNPQIDGILLLRPLPKHLDEEAVVDRISPEKDLDGISPVNLAKVFAGDKTGFAPWELMSQGKESRLSAGVL